MLALTDEALARLVRAAQQVSHRKRSRWLRTTALALEGGTPNAQRVRKHRARVANGHRIYRLDLDSVAIETMLEREGLLSLDPTHIEVERALTDFIHWLCKLPTE